MAWSFCEHIPPTIPPSVLWPSTLLLVFTINISHRNMIQVIHLPNLLSFIDSRIISTHHCQSLLQGGWQFEEHLLSGFDWINLLVSVFPKMLQVTAWKGWSRAVKSARSPRAPSRKLCVIFMCYRCPVNFSTKVTC